MAPAASPDALVAGAVASTTVVPPVPWALPDDVLARRLWDLRWAVAGPRREVALNAPWTASVVDRLPPLLAGLRPDAVLVEHPALAPTVAARSDRGEPWMLTLHNIGSTLAEHEAAVTTGARQRWLLRQERRKCIRFEGSCGDTFDRVVCVTEDDAALVRGGALVVPNGVDCGGFVPSALPSEPLVVLTGALHTAPNIDGATWFVAEVWPSIVAARSDARLRLVGSRPPATVRALASPSVSVHADVPTTVPHVTAARVCVVPLRLGSGSRLKALEALASGRPVVGTSIGLAGLTLRPGVDALIEDDAVGLAAAVVRVLDDDELAASLAAAGPRFIARQHLCWAEVAPRFTAEVLRLVSR